MSMQQEHPIYLALSSGDSLPYFPGNNATRFTTLLSVPLELSGVWYISLRDVVIHLTREASKALAGHILFDVFVSEASGAILRGAESSLVCRVCAPVKRGRTLVAMSRESYDRVPIRAQYLDRVEVVIKPVFPESIAFDKQTAAYATLVLSQ